MSVSWVEVPIPSLDQAASYDADGLWDIVNDIGDVIVEAINDVFRWLYGMVDGHIDEMGAVLGAAAGTAVGGPIGGILGGIGGYLAGDALQNWARGKVNDAFDKVEAAWTSLWDKICWFARQVAGDPLELYLNYQDYNTSTTELSEILNDLEGLKSRIDTYWDGVAAGEYTDEVSAQITATTRLKDNSKMLSVISSGGAVDVLSGWLWLPLQMQRVASEVLGVIGGAFDAGKLILGEAGPIIEFVNVGLNFILDAVDEILVRVEASVRAAAELASETADVEGFPDGAWPAGSSPEVLNSPANWDPTEVY